MAWRRQAVADQLLHVRCPGDAAVGTDLQVPLEEVRARSVLPQSSQSMAEGGGEGAATGRGGRNGTSQGYQAEPND